MIQTGEIYCLETGNVVKGLEPYPSGDHRMGRFAGERQQDSGGRAVDCTRPSQIWHAPRDWQPFYRWKVTRGGAVVFSNEFRHFYPLPWRD